MKLRKLLVLLMLAVFALVLSACGAQGEAGAQGPQGEKGETGAQGAKGPTGDTGETGDDGEAGADGVGVEFSFTSDGLAWRYVGDKTWNIGVTYAEIFAQINQAGVGQTISKVGFDYVVDQTLTVAEGAEVDVYGIKKVMGTTAFTTLEDAFDAINNDSAESVKLFVNKGDYTVGEGKEAVLTKSNVLVFGPNVNVNPNTETRVAEANINSKVTFAGNNIEVNGLNFATDGRIYAANTGVENFKVQYVVFDETLTLKSSSADEGCLTLRISYALENANTMWYKNVTLAYSRFECNNARATRIVANQVDGISIYGNVFNGKSSGIYDDCLKFYLWGEEKTAGFVSIKGNVKVYGNEFNNVGQYCIWLNSYGPMNVDIQGNSFVSCGMTDDKDTQVNNGYIRGVLTALVSANYDYTQKTTINFCYNTVSNASCGVRIENGGFDESNFEANVNYNVFDEIAVGAEIITNRGKNAAALINAEYNCFTAIGGVTLENNFKGVKSIANAYASATQVPTKTLQELLAK